MALIRETIEQLWQKIVGSHKDVAFYTFSSLIKTAATFAAGLITARYIDPKDLGLWSAISLVTTYAMFFQGGVINGVSRELPYYLGGGEKEKSELCAGTAQTFVVLIGILTLLIGCVLIVVYRHETGSMLFALITVIFITSFFFYQNYLIVTFRSKNSFNALAKAQLLTSLLMFLTIPMIYLWRYEGMLLRIILISAITVIILHVVRPMRVPLMWSWSMFFGLMKVGIPIFILSYIELSAMTMDKIVLLWFGGVEQVGYYILAMITWSSMVVLPISIIAYVYPRMTYVFGKNNDVIQVWNMALKTTITIIAIMLPLVIVGYFALPLLVPVLFPKYVDGIFAAQIFLFCSLFYGAGFSVNALWSMKAWKYMIAFQLSRSALLLCGPLVGGFLIDPVLSGVAYGVLGAYIISFFLGISMTYHATHLPESQQK